MKRGLSEVVTAVILILLVLAAVAIIWVFIRPTIEDTSSRVGVSQFTSTLDVVSKSVNVDDNSNEVNFTVSKGAGGDIEGFIVILRDDQGNEEINRTYENTALNELESEKVSVTHNLPGEIIEIEVVSVFDVNGQSQLSSIKSTYSVRTGTTIVSNPQGAVCGNNIVESGETCDDGNTDNGDGCSSVCQTEGQPLSCPNGNIDVGEQCDGANLNGNTCIDLGYVSGTLGCLTDCLGYNVSLCNNVLLSANGVGFESPPTPNPNAPGVYANNSYRVKFLVNSSHPIATPQRYSYLDFSNTSGSAMLSRFGFDDSDPLWDSHNARVGILGGSAVIGSSGKYGKMLSLNGNTNTHLQFPDTLGLQNRKEFSVSVWFKANSLPFTGNLFPGIIGIGAADGLAPNQNRTLFLFGDGLNPGSSNLTLHSGTIGDPYDDCEITKIGPLSQSVWYHAVIVKNETHCSFYLNGAKSGRGTDGGLVGQDALASSNTRTTSSSYGAGYSNLGSLQRVGSADWYFNGDIDEFVVFGRAISESEINYLYNGGDYDVVLTSLPTVGTHRLVANVINSSGQRSNSFTLNYAQAP